MKANTDTAARPAEGCALFDSKTRCTIGFLASMTDRALLEQIGELNEWRAAG
jgi:hypothetical protein